MQNARPRKNALTRRGEILGRLCRLARNLISRIPSGGVARLSKELSTRTKKQGGNGRLSECRGNERGKANWSRPSNHFWSEVRRGLSFRPNNDNDTRLGAAAVADNWPNDIDVSRCKLPASKSAKLHVPPTKSQLNETTSIFVPNHVGLSRAGKARSLRWLRSKFSSNVIRLTTCQGLPARTRVLRRNKRMQFSMAFNHRFIIRVSDGEEGSWK